MNMRQLVKWMMRGDEVVVASAFLTFSLGVCLVSLL